MLNATVERAHERDSTEISRVYVQFNGVFYYMI